MIHLGYKLAAHPNLATREVLSALLSPFGATDTESIIISSDPSRKTRDKPPKFGTALPPFTQIGGAFAAVCASGRADWDERHRAPVGRQQRARDRPLAEEDGSASFVGLLVAEFPAAPKPGVDYEVLTLMRLRQAERERLEREILEQEAAE
ncbi:hypothetical protein DFH09DRAFT_1382703 [Mycena vulgaris]|nr:hypothetical protein DFH09DRAFT_1382703 [Mycena vulgaris]